MKKSYVPITVLLGLTGLAYLGFRTASENLKPQMPDIARARGENLANSSCRVLAITAHPDDLEFFAGGLLRRMQLMGSRISVVDVSNGEKGTRVENLAEIRQKEQKSAAAIQGYQEVYFLELPDLSIAINNPAKPICRLIEHTKPDIILTFDHKSPLAFIRHPDHQAVGQAVADAVINAGYRGPVIYYGSSKPNLSVNITGVMNTKIQAILAHASQLRISPRLYPPLIRGYHKLGARPRAPYVELLRIEEK